MLQRADAAHWVPHRAVVRLLVGALAAAMASVVASLHFGGAVAVLTGWDAGGLLMGALSWATIRACDANQTSCRAAAEDPGRTAVYMIVVLTSAVGLFAATVLSRQAKTIAPNESYELIGLCLATVAISWALTHTAFTLRYAHLYYREDDDGVGGLDFPRGLRPTYFDFAYFAFTIGMCFQVSDVIVVTAQMRRAVLLHALISFTYNTAILAFALNLAFGTPNG